MRYSFTCNQPFYLRPVRSRVGVFGIGDAVLKCAVIAQQQQAFAIEIETPRRIYVRDRNEIRQRLGIAVSGARSELAEDVEGLVEQQVAECQDEDRWEPS